MDSKKIGQVVLLVVLLGVLIGGMLFNINKANQAKKRRAESLRSIATASRNAEGDSAKAAPASDRTEGGAQNVTEEDREFKDPYLNPNVFRTHELSSPRNPFVQKLEWYAQNLDGTMPGYPELQDSDYFDQIDAFLPDMDLIYDGEKKWSNISIQRRRDNKYTISGESEDGQISTQISLEEDIPAQSNFTWTADSGIPLKSLKDPDFVRQQLNRNPQPSGGLDSLIDLFGDNPPPIGTVVDDSYEVVKCKGVSLGREGSSALLEVNGLIRLVTQGQVLPPLFRVQEITADGVVLADIQNNENVWVPLQKPTR